MIKIKYKGSSRINEVPRSKKVEESEDAIPYLKELIGDLMREKEVFCALFLDGSSRVCGKEVIHIGTLNQSLVHPREVFRPAIMANCAGIIIAHNHPSGTLEASRSDISITRRLQEVGILVGIAVLDHIILTEDGHYSFESDDMM